jgi:hypothetical protein
VTPTPLSPTALHHANPNTPRKKNSSKIPTNSPVPTAPAQTPTPGTPPQPLTPNSTCTATTAPTMINPTHAHIPKRPNSLLHLPTSIHPLGFSPHQFINPTAKTSATPNSTRPKILEKGKTPGVIDSTARATGHAKTEVVSHQSPKYPKIPITPRFIRLSCAPFSAHRQLFSSPPALPQSDASFNLL